MRLELRPAVDAFAQLMEAKLRENDHKGGWQHDTAGDLCCRLEEEARELRDALALYGARTAVPAAAVLKAPARVVIGREAADVANFAMMIADVCGALPAPATPEDRHGHR